MVAHSIAIERPSVNATKSASFVRELPATVRQRRTSHGGRKSSVRALRLLHHFVLSKRPIDSGLKVFGVNPPGEIFYPDNA
jgi:hypothetical protein